jgi:hypothetical protein
MTKFREKWAQYSDSSSKITLKTLIQKKKKKKKKNSINLLFKISF